MIQKSKVMKKNVLKVAVMMTVVVGWYRATDIIP
jgi:hypothetical protein